MAKLTKQVNPSLYLDCMRKCSALSKCNLPVEEGLTVVTSAFLARESVQAEALYLPANAIAACNQSTKPVELGNLLL
jgi:hypothetical protein